MQIVLPWSSMMQSAGTPEAWCSPSMFWVITAETRPRLTSSVTASWDYVCPRDRSRTQFDIGSELLTSVPHHRRRIQFHTLPENYERRPQITTTIPGAT